jgi:hypothetical protein
MKLLSFLTKNSSLLTGEVVDRLLASQLFKDLELHVKHSQDYQVVMAFGKLLFLLHLKTPGIQSLDAYLTTSTDPALTLYLLHAHVIRGSMKGYN